MIRTGKRLSPACALPAALAAALAAPIAFADDPTQLPSITVTAQKRSEDLLAVPISAMAMDQDAMDKLSVKDIGDIARLVPGLTFQPDDDAGDTNIAIRGIISSVGASTTGIYIDEVPVMVRLDSGVGSNPYPKVFDLDRLEVLRGPQGTLFGAGAEGGALRFITPEASLHKFSGFASADLATTRNGDPSYEAGVAAGGPLIDGKLGYRFSAWHRLDGGYGDRVDPATGATLATRDNYSDSDVLHLNLKWVPLTDLVITPGIFYQANRAGDVGLDFEANGTYDTASLIRQPHYDRFALSTLNVDYAFSAFNFKSVTSYIDRRVNQKYDGTAFELGSITGSTSVPFDPNYLVVVDYYSTQRGVTQEFRLTSPDDSGSKLSWVTGVFYRESASDSQSYYNDPGFNAFSNYLSVQNGYGPGNALSYWGEAPLGGIYSYIDNFPGSETDLAAYGDATYALTPALKVSAGLRLARSGYSYTDFQDGPWGPAAPFHQAGSQAEKPITPRLTVSWQVDKERMVYFSAAKGYRGGGANEPVPVGTAGGCSNDLAQLGLSQVPATYDSDHLWSYETGLKGRFLDNTVQIESSLFWIDWDKIQQSIYLATCGYNYIANLGRTISRGFDLKADWTPTKHLVFTFTSGYTDVHHKDDIILDGNLLAKAGDRLPTPTWTYTAGGEYRFTPWGGAEGFARLDYEFNGSYERFGSNDTFGAYPQTNYAPPIRYATARLGAKFDGYEVSVYGSNLFDKSTSLFQYQTVLTSTDFKDVRLRPFTIGLSGKYRF
jgi:outer membrane receptor protein involved in Fe transport